MRKVVNFSPLWLITRPPAGQLPNWDHTALHCVAACNEVLQKLLHFLHTHTSFHLFTDSFKLHWQQQCYPCNPRCREVCGVTPEVRLRRWGLDTVPHLVVGITFPTACWNCWKIPMRPFNCFQQVLAEFQSESFVVYCARLEISIFTSGRHKQKEREKNAAMKSIEYLAWRHWNQQEALDTLLISFFSNIYTILFLQSIGHYIEKTCIVFKLIV